jgi:hypothetical protein
MGLTLEALGVQLDTMEMRIREALSSSFVPSWLFIEMWVIPVNNWKQYFLVVS